MVGIQVRCNIEEVWGLNNNKKIKNKTIVIIIIITIATIIIIITTVTHHESHTGTPLNHDIHISEISKYIYIYR